MTAAAAAANSYIPTSGIFMTETIFKCLVQKGMATPIEVQEQFNRFFQVLDTIGLCHMLGPITDHVPNACSAFALYQGLNVMGAVTIFSARHLNMSYKN